MKTQNTIFTIILVAICSIFVGLSSTFAQIPPQAQEKVYRDGYKTIATSNKTNAQLKYYYYFPADVVKNPGKRHNVMVMVPGLGNSESEVVTKQVKSFADQRGTIILSPLFKFNEQDFKNYAAYQYPKAWSGKALTDIIKTLNKAGIRTGGLYMFGISAGAQYTLRYALDFPANVRASAGHAPGGSIIPEKSVSVKFFKTIGANDSKDRMGVHEQFKTLAKAKGLNVKSKIYPGLGHSMSPAVTSDVLNFFRTNGI